MLCSIRKIITLSIATMILTISAEATAIFAKQYSLKCSVCHVGVPPALNTTGQSFYRNGLKFSDKDKTTIEKIEKDNFVPISVMLGMRARGGASDMIVAKGKKAGKTIHNSSDYIEPTFKMMSAGSINKNFSYFIGGKWAYMNTDPKDENQKKINLEGRKAYLMYTSSDRTHAVRIGSMSPYAQLGNIKRSVEGSGINDKIHITPLVRANVNDRVLGVDYAYRHQSGFGLLLSLGSLTEDLNHLIDNDRMNYVIGLDYYNENNFRTSFVINHTESINSDVYSSNLDNTIFMIPIEYDINNKLFINTALVYEAENTSANTDEYYGIELATSYMFMENAHLRLISSYDNDDSSTFSLKYSQIFMDNLFLTIQGTKTNSESPVPLNPMNNQAMFSSATATSYTVSLSYIY